MYIRQVTAKLLRRILIPSKTLVSSNALPNSLSCKTKFSYKHGCGGSSWRLNDGDSRLWMIMAGQAGIIFGINANIVLADASVESSSKNDLEGLRKIEDGSVKSNIHTSKWRIFTDNGREYFQQGNFDQAEKFFLSALEEAKEGFGDRDPHVASACNNLAELYRVNKQFDKAEPLYLEAINMLEDSFGPEDVRVGAALHSLGQLYLMQRKLEEACKCYERALKIKGRVLGLGHTDYASTMYKLGGVLYLLGKEKDAEALIQESITILEENGQGESSTCIGRLRYLAEMYLRSSRLSEAENVQRKILHIMELSKGWNSMDTVIAAGALARTLQSNQKFRERQELLERCLEARKTLLPEGSIQIAANMVDVARAAMLYAIARRKTHFSEAIAELDKAKDLLYNAKRIARQVLNKLRVQNGKEQKMGVSEEIRREELTAFAILLRSLDAVGLVEITEQELQNSMGQKIVKNVEAENSLFHCISTYKEFEAERSLADSSGVKTEYLSCLRHLLVHFDKPTIQGKVTWQELTDEIKRVEVEISHSRTS